MEKVLRGKPEYVGRRSPKKRRYVRLEKREGKLNSCVIQAVGGL